MSVNRLCIFSTIQRSIQSIDHERPGHATSVVLNVNKILARAFKALNGKCKLRYAIEITNSLYNTVQSGYIDHLRIIRFGTL